MSSGEYDKHRRIDKELSQKFEGMSGEERFAWILNELAAINGVDNAHDARIGNLEERIGLMLTRMENLEDHMGHSIGAWPMPAEEIDQKIRTPRWPVLIGLLVFFVSSALVAVIMAITNNPILLLAAFGVFSALLGWGVIALIDYMVEREEG